MKIGQFFRMLRKLLNGGSIKKRSAETPRRNGPELDMFVLGDIIHLERMLFYIMDSVKKNMDESLFVKFRETAFFMNGKRHDALTKNEIQFCNHVLILANKCLVSGVLEGRSPDAKWLPKLRRTIERRRHEIAETSMEHYQAQEKSFVRSWAFGMISILKHIEKDESMQRA